MTVGKLLRLAAGDNVYIATADLASGDVVTSTGDVVTLGTPVDLGHKIAAQDIPAGAQVVRSGMPIGRATTPIGAGEWVHTHNLRSDYIATLEHRGGPG
jgi:SAF domain